MLNKRSIVIGFLINFSHSSVLAISNFNFFHSRERTAFDIPRAVELELKRQSLDQREREGFQTGVILAEEAVSKDLLKANKLALSLAQEQVSLRGENGHLKTHLGGQLQDLKQRNTEMADKIKYLQVELAVTQSGATSIAQMLLSKIRNSQTDSVFKFQKLQTCLGESEKKLESQSQTYKEKLEGLLLQIVEQKRLYAQLEENFRKVKETLDVARMANPTLSAELAVNLRENQELAARVAKRDSMLASLTTQKRSLEKQLKTYNDERSILQTSLDSLYKSNGTLLTKNQAMEGFLKDKEKEIASKVHKLAELERQQSEFQAKMVELQKKLDQKDPTRLLKVASEFAQKLARADQEHADLKQHIAKLQTITDQTKLAHKEFLVQATRDKELVKNLELQLAESTRAIGNLKGQQQIVLKQLGIDAENPEKSPLFARQASKLQMRELYAQVVCKGKAFLDDNLKKSLESSDLTKSLVDDLEKRVILSKNNAQDSSFSKIFRSLESNNLKSSFSKLYTHFLAKNCAGFSDPYNFERYKDLSKEYFQNSLIGMVEASDLSDPKNYLLMSLV